MLEVPQGGRGLTELRSANPYLAPHQPHVGVVGHTTDRCTTLQITCTDHWEITVALSKYRLVYAYMSRGLGQ